MFTSELFVVWFGSLVLIKSKQLLVLLVFSSIGYEFIVKIFELTFSGLNRGCTLLMKVFHHNWTCSSC
jgi:hypothetical protein